MTFQCVRGSILFFPRLPSQLSRRFPLAFREEKAASHFGALDRRSYVSGILGIWSPDCSKIQSSARALRLHGQLDHRFSPRNDLPDSLGSV